MTSKRLPANKRASFPRSADYTKQFSKDWIRLSRSGRYDMHRLKTAMMLLIANDSPLGAEYKDHDLSANWEGFRECHVGGDFLLIYLLDEQKNAIEFVRAGTHSELFG